MCKTDTFRELIYMLHMHVCRREKNQYLQRFTLQGQPLASVSFTHLSAVSSYLSTREWSFPGSMPLIFSMRNKQKARK